VQFIPIYDVESSTTYRGARIKVWLRTRAMRIALLEALPSWVQSMMRRFLTI
jgi:hypothetical protein